MFRIEKSRPMEPSTWHDADRDQAIERARAALLAPGDVVTVTDSASGDTAWMGVIGRDGLRHEWNGNEPRQVRVEAAAT